MESPTPPSAVLTVRARLSQSDSDSESPSDIPEAEVHEPEDALVGPEGEELPEWIQEMNRKMHSNSVHSSSRRPKTRRSFEAKSQEAATTTTGKWAFQEKECFQINYFQGKESESVKSDFESGSSSRGTKTASYRNWQLERLGMLPAATSQAPQAVVALPEYDSAEVMALDVKGLFDSHCHIDFLFRRLTPYPASFEIFREKMSEAFPKSFGGCLAVWCDPASWKSHTLVSASKDVVTCFGCHPHHAAQMTEAMLEDLRLLLTSVPSVVAVGEFGLDYSHRNTCDRDVQKTVFKEHVRLAIELKLPICLHLREANAYEDGMQLLQEMSVPPDFRIHLHCFKGPKDTMDKWLSTYSNCYIGFTPLAKDSDARAMAEVIRSVPLDRILLETDAPYFQVEKAYDIPFKGTSHPGIVIHTAAQVAKIRDVQIQWIIEANRKNVESLYGVEAAKRRMLLAKHAKGQRDVSAIPLPSQVKVTRARVEDSSEDEGFQRQTDRRKRSNSRLSSPSSERIPKSPRPQSSNMDGVGIVEQRGT